jgi:FlaA1/EpsC-like NDP-sugar epimerase
MKTSTQVNDILQAISDLELEEQSYIAEILTKRTIELRRNQIASRAKEAEENYRLGNIRTVTVEDLIRDQSVTNRSWNSR